MNLYHESGAMVIPGDRLGRLSTALPKATSVTTQQQQPRQLQQPLHVQYVAGEGTYVRNDCIVASVVGRVNILSAMMPMTSDSNAEKITSEVRTNSNHADSESSPLQMVTVSVIPKDGCFRAKQQVVRVGQTILGRVVRIGMAQQQQVMVDIVANPYGVLDCVAHGTIRREDITKILPASTVTAVNSPQSQLSNPSTVVQQLSQSFRVGDWVAAKVVSLGDDPNRRYCLSTAESSLGVVHAICSTSGQPMIPVSHREMECPVTGTIEARKCARPPTMTSSTTAHVGEE